MRPPIETSPARGIAAVLAPCLVAVVLVAGCKSGDAPAAPPRGSNGGATGGGGGSIPVGPVGHDAGTPGTGGGGTTPTAGTGGGTTPTGGTGGAVPADASD